MRSKNQSRLDRLESGDFRYCFCCSDPPPPPDMSGVTNATTEVAKMQQDQAKAQLAWAQQQDTMNRETLNKVLNVQLPAMQSQADAAVKDRARYEQMFQPLENNLVQEAQDYASPERQMMERGKAIADVSNAFNAQRTNALQRLESYGVDPSQTRNSALDIGVRTAQAAASAGAAQQAGQNVQNTGRALRSEAINVGKGYPSQSLAGFSGANQSGNSAVGNSGSTTGSGAGAMNSALGWAQGAQSGFGQAGNMMTQNYQNQQAHWQAGQDQTMGWVNAASGIAGMAMMADGGTPMPTQAIPFQADGRVPLTADSDGSGIDDKVDAKLSAGEFVIPADVVRIKGEEFFHKLIEKYHTPAAQQRRAVA